MELHQITVHHIAPNTDVRSVKSRCASDVDCLGLRLQIIHTDYNRIQVNTT